MTRVTNGVATKQRRKRILKQTRGYWGNKSRLFRYAHDAFWRAGAFAFRDRRKKKSEFRQLWIVRINAACRAAWRACPGRGPERQRIPRCDHRIVLR